MPVSIGKPARRTDKYFGERSVPKDVLRRRRSVYDMLRRMGSPILVKHRFSDLDFQNGVVEKSAVYDDVYGQTRNRDPLSYGVGYVSVELSDDEWYDETGETGDIVVSVTSPGEGFVKAPKYRGFGPGNLTYIIEPDRAQDYFKNSPGGPLIQVQEATAIAPWWPEINDNDLLINVVLGANGKIVDTRERFEAKQTNPVSMRGLDRRGRREYTENFGNSFVVNQTFEMSLIPANDVAYLVETDR